MGRTTSARTPDPVGVIGAGYVGLVTGACLAELGHPVTVREIDSAKLQALHDGRVPIHEPGLAQLISANADRIRFTQSIDELLYQCKVLIVAVDTPPTYSGDADLSSVINVLRELASGSVSSDHVVVMKSTVPVGTGQRLRAEMDRLGLTAARYVSNPEFLREGSAVGDFMRPSRIVIGDFRREDGDRVEAIYGPLGAPVLRTDVPSAEMIKYASNAFLATKISFINEIANVCEEVGADVALVATGMGLDPRIGEEFLGAGIGYGGSCFPKDVAALKQLAGNSGYHFQLLTSVIEVNELQKRRVIGKLKRHLGALDGTVVTLLGLTFKPGTDDMREAASLVLAARLLAEGVTVRAYDPMIGPDALDPPRGISIFVSAEDALDGADAAVLVTEWPQFRTLDWASIRATMRHPLVVDGRNALQPEAMRAAGYVYEAIGRPAPT